nr:hypothetical protein [Bosea sp. BIWAKO-01]
MTQGDTLQVQVATASTPHRASRANDRHIPHDTRVPAVQLFGVESQAPKQSAKQRRVGVVKGGEPAEIGLGDGIVSGQFGGRHLAQCLEFSQEHLNAPPLANRFNDLHGYLHILARLSARRL